MTRKTLVLGLALAAVTTIGAVPAFSAGLAAAGTSSDTAGPVPEPERTKDPKDKDKDKDKDASPSPTPDESGCRDVTDGGAMWIRPVTLPQGLGEVPLGSAIIDSESVLAAPSCPEVTYSFVLFDAAGEEVQRFATAGTGEGTVRVREVVDYDETCVHVQFQVSEMVGGQPVLHDAAPDAPVEICDKGLPGSGGQVWR